MAEGSLSRSILVSLLKPVARFCLRHSFGIRDLVDAGKLALIQAAVEDMEKNGVAVSVSRVAVMTGIYRDEVSRFLKKKKNVEEKETSLVARVITQWRLDARFVDRTGEPRELVAKGEASELWELCKSVSKNLNPRTLAYELVRGGYAEEVDGKIRLLKRMQTYIGDPEKGFNLVGRDFDAVLNAAEENILNPDRITNVHVHTEFDNIVREAIPRIRRWVMDESKEFHRRIREFLGQYDRDINPELPFGEPVKVIVGGFSWTPRMPAEDEVTPGHAQNKKTEGKEK